MSHPKRADHFKKWAQLMVEQAIVPDRLEYKSTRASSASSQKKSSKGRKRRLAKRKKRFLRRKRKQQE